MVSFGFSSCRTRLGGKIASMRINSRAQAITPRDQICFVPSPRQILEGSFRCINSRPGRTHSPVRTPSRTWRSSSPPWPPLSHSEFLPAAGGFKLHHQRGHEKFYRALLYSDILGTEVLRFRRIAAQKEPHLHHQASL